MNKFQNPNYHAAKKYAIAHNLNVIPSSKEKYPLIQDWYHNASKDPTIIAEWWDKWPDANVSMPTGSATGIIVLDIDVKNGQPGFDSLKELEIKYGNFPKTPTSVSPSGGKHLFFKYEGPQIKRRIGFKPGLDLMAEDSQVLLPPSIGALGKKYKWEPTKRIDEVPFAFLPECLQNLVLGSNTSNQDATRSQTPTLWKPLVREGAPEGERNQSVAKFAGYLLRRYVDPHVALELILLWNRHKNPKPLSDEEVIRTVNSIAGKELHRRRTRGVK